MAFIVSAYIIDPGDGMIKVRHDFYGSTMEEADTYFKEHLGSCEYFRAAQKEDRLIETVEEVDEEDLPRPEEFYEEEE
jgi:F420-dependent methylenetetrahydromethanopterin dehydrogenase